MDGETELIWFGSIGLNVGMETRHTNNTHRSRFRAWSRVSMEGERPPWRQNILLGGVMDGGSVRYVLGGGRDSKHARRVGTVHTADRHSH